EEGYEARLTIWGGGEPETELRLTEFAELPGLLPQLVDSLAGGPEPVVQRFTRVEGLHYLLLAPLPEGRMLSVAIPPRQQVGRSTALARFLQPAGEGAAAPNESLVLIPATDELAAAPATAPPPPVTWTRTATGWRAEAG